MTHLAVESATWERHLESISLSVASVTQGQFHPDALIIILPSHVLFQLTS